MGEPLREDPAKSAQGLEDIQISTLSNGVRVVTDRMSGIASAAVAVYVGAGARHESAEQNGIAHFLEHMAFKGTTSRTALKIAEEIEDVGGDLNAYTSREATCYHARILAEHVPLAVELLADIFRNATLPDEDIELERGVILQEIGQCFDTPDDIVFDWAQETAFPGQAMGRSILGPAANVKRFDRAALRGFIDSAYAPGNTIIAAAGRVEHDEIVRLAERHFGDIASHPVVEAEPAAYRGGDRRVEKDLEQIHAILGFPGPSYLDDAYYTSQIAASVLAGGMSSRLFQEVREKRGLCYTIFAAPSHYREAGWMSIYAGTGGDSVRELLDVTVDELKKMADGVRAEEVDRAREYMRASMLMALESPAARCQRVARTLCSYGRIASAPEILQKVFAVRPDDVATFCAEQIRGAPTVTLYGPVAAAPSYEELCSRLSA